MSEDIVYGLLAVVAVAVAIESIAYSLALIRDANAEIERSRELSKRIAGQQVDDQIVAASSEDPQGEIR